jgi:hypothetical protein
MVLEESILDTVRAILVGEFEIAILAQIIMPEIQCPARFFWHFDWQDYCI